MSMVSWLEFAAEAPDLKAAGARLFQTSGIAYLATVRRDGRPRLHPVVPVEAGAGLFVAINRKSPKRLDLANDGRYALHAALGDRDEEFVITGVAVRHKDRNSLEQLRAAAGHAIHDSDWIFEFMVATCLWGYWERVGKPDTYPVRQFWRVP